MVPNKPSLRQPKDHLSVAKKNLPKIKTDFFPHKNKQKQSKIYIHIRTVTIKQTHMNNRHIITIVRWNVSSCPMLSTSMLTHTNILTREAMTLLLCNTVAEKGLIPHCLRGHWPSMWTKNNRNHGHCIKVMQECEISRVKLSKRIAQRLIWERFIRAESPRLNWDTRTYATFC